MKLQHVAATVKGAQDRFTGEVYATPIADPGEGSSLAAGAIQFAPGARTHWHVHPGGQTLYVTSGIGLVATRDGEVVRVRSGDTIHTPPGEEHWHGATGDHQMCHVAMVVARPGEPATTWLEAVSEDEYLRAAAVLEPDDGGRVR